LSIATDEIKFNLTLFVRREPLLGIDPDDERIEAERTPPAGTAIGAVPEGKVKPKRANFSDAHCRTSLA